MARGIGWLALVAMLGRAASPASGAAAPSPVHWERGEAVANEQRWIGRPLADVLRELQSRGLAIVFTGEVVRPEMKVEREPGARAPRALLDEILAAHGLEAREGPGGVLVVVATPALSQREVASISGAVATVGGGPLPGALVRLRETSLEARTDEEGRFTLEAVPPGRHSVVATAPGYLDRHVTVTVGDRGAREIVFRLQPQPYLEEEILVRPSRLTLLEKQPESSFSFSGEEIRSLPHLGDDVFRATSLLPGTAANDVTARFSIHGGRPDEVKVLLDGQELYDAHHLRDYDSALSVVPAQALASADLSTGAYPVRDGDRMGGVLDLRTGDPATGVARHLIGASALELFASSSGTFRETSGWLVSARRGSIDLANRFLGSESPGFWDLLGKLDLDTGAGRFGIRGLVARDELELDEASEDGFERLENDYRMSYGWLTHQAAPHPRLTVESLASWSGIRRDRGGETSEEEGSFVLRDRRDLEVRGLSQSWSFDSGGRHHTRWGWELRRYESTFDFAKDLDPDLVILAPFATPRVLEHVFAGTVRGDHTGGWVSDRAALGDRLTVLAGLRFDRHTATADEVWSPRVNLALRIDEHSVVRGSWGRFYQSQRPYELQVEDGEPSLFAAERTEHSVLGYERILASNPLGIEGVRLELYHREVADPRPRWENLLEPLNFFPEIEPDRVRIAPLSSTAEGVELLLRGRRGSRFGWWLAYAHAQSEDRMEATEAPRALDQPHTLTVNVDHRFGRQWSVSAALRYHSGWPTTPVRALTVSDPEDPDEPPELVAVFGSLRSERLAVYHRLDLRASRSWSIGERRLTFFLDVQNLYDRANLAGYDVDFDDETGAIALEEENWPGIFPSLGITFEF